MNYQPHPYQDHSTKHILEHPGCGLFLEMGLGKTVATLTAIDQLMNDYMEISRVLVIAPKRVAEEVWTTEGTKWDHLKHLKFSLVLGTARQRKEALLTKADIFVINRENVAWLIGHYGTHFPFDMVVIDELSSFKDAKAIRFKSLRQIRPKVKRVVGLTGTPTPNSLLDLWPQLYLLDMGERLGDTLTGFRTKFFRKDPHKPFAKYEVLQEPDPLMGENYYEKKIYEKIGDICISMQAKDYLTLPERVERTVNVKLSPQNFAKYQAFEKEKILEMQDIEDISAINAAALVTKLLQFANGAIYDNEIERNWHEVHDEKLEELEEIVEVANGQSVLIFYSYKHDWERIQKRLKKYKLVKLEKSQEITDWNDGKIQVMAAHPASAGHGLNLQAGGHIVVWFGLPWSLELYQQANARLDRQGQKTAVIIHRLIAMGTMDEDVLLALDNKANSQDALMKAVKARVKKYLN